MVPIIIIFTAVRVPKTGWETKIQCPNGKHEYFVLLSAGVPVYDDPLAWTSKDIANLFLRTKARAAEFESDWDCVRE